MVKQEEKAKFPFELVKTELAEVEKQIKAQAREFDPAVEPYVTYICDAKGKRIRPALSVLVGGATGGVKDTHIKLGLILELIHMASLVHDDIMDKADTRRGKATANARWGNSITVLLGDSLFAHALMLSTDFDDAAFCRIIAAASREVCMGEILQTQRQFDLQLSTKEYYRIIEMKTAALFGAACALAAKLNDQPDAVVTALDTFGRKLGTAYQIYDDCLDLVGDDDEVGKTLRTDLAKGKLTLPILKLIAGANESQREKLGKILIQKEPLDIATLAGIADYEGSLEAAIDEGQQLAVSARDELIGLPDTPYVEALRDITSYLEGLFDLCRS